MVLALIKEYGQAKKWPHDSDIFGEGYAVMQHLSARGSEQEHIPLYLPRGPDDPRRRGVKEMYSRRCLNGAQDSLCHSWEDALLILWAVVCGSRYLKRPKFEGSSPKPDTTAIVFHRDQIHAKEKCNAREEERTFVLLPVSADIRPES